MRLLLVILLVMVACKAPSCRAAVAVSASAASWKVAAVQSAMQQMLDFEPSKESGGGVDGGPQKAGGHQATGYMVHLYRKYLASHKMKQDSSTIRSIGANFGTKLIIFHLLYSISVYYYFCFIVNLLIVYLIIGVIMLISILYVVLYPIIRD